MIPMIFVYIIPTPPEEIIPLTLLTWQMNYISLIFYISIQIIIISIIGVGTVENVFTPAY